jgi:hypothetical protein
VLSLINWHSAPNIGRIIKNKEDEMVGELVCGKQEIQVKFWEVSKETNVLLRR